MLVVAPDGALKLVCLPDSSPPRTIFPGERLTSVADSQWRDGPLIAGWADASDEKGGAELVLLAADSRPRRLGANARMARIAPDGQALAYETIADQSPTTHVLDLRTGAIMDLGSLTDPLWESDARHLRATRLPTAAEKQRVPPVTWASLRVRWDRESGASTVDGRGSAQIPAPSGEAFAWSEDQRDQRGAAGAGPCGVFLNRRGGVRHSVVGPFCMGIADDRGVRWSPDGHWLAFAHPGPLPGQHERKGFFVDVVGVAGGRYPALSDVHERARPEDLAMAVVPDPVWFDWSPSGRFLVMSDGASQLRVYDFEAKGVAPLGQGRRPQWSPGGGYLVVLSGAQSRSTGEAATETAVVLSGTEPSARMAFGPARDVRWLPAQACD